MTLEDDMEQPLTPILWRHLWRFRLLERWDAPYEIHLMRTPKCRYALRLKSGSPGPALRRLGEIQNFRAKITRGTHARAASNRYSPNDSLPLCRLAVLALGVSVLLPFRFHVLC